MNKVLAAANDRLFGSSRYGDGPGSLVLVFGIPRSGTTLATQLLAHGLDCEYVTHAMARFYKAPLVGASLSRSLWSHSDVRRGISFGSCFGRTDDPRDHYGYFWRAALGTDEYGTRTGIRRGGLITELLSASCIPWVMQGQHPSLHMEWVEQQCSGKVVWVRIRRDKKTTIASIERALKAGIRLLGYRDNKTPGEYYESMERRLGVLSENRQSLINVDYESVCEDPMKFLGSIASVSGCSIKNNPPDLRAR